MFFNCDFNHSEAECRCYAKPGAAAQSLDELEFVRSACHAAQTGQLEKLERILRNRPAAVNSDGGTGTLGLRAPATGSYSQAFYYSCNCQTVATDSPD